MLAGVDTRGEGRPRHRGKRRIGGPQTTVVSLVTKAREVGHLAFFDEPFRQVGIEPVETKKDQLPDARFLEALSPGESTPQNAERPDQK